MKPTRAAVRPPVVAAVLVVLAAGALQAASLRTVRDPGNRFMIGVPATWTVQTSTASRSPAVSAKAPASPGQLPDSVDVTARDFATSITPAACASDAALVMRFTIHTWTTLHQGPTTLAGLSAYSRSYVWRTSAGAQRRSTQICVTVGRRAFVLVGTTGNTAADVNRDLPQIERIMATFRPVTSTLPPPAMPAPSGGPNR